MAGTEEQEERRGDTVAIPRSTYKAASWIASIAFVGVATFIWDSGDKVHELESTIELIVDKLNAINARVEDVEDACEGHREATAHREQIQLNREFIRRLDKVENASRSIRGYDYLQDSGMNGMNGKQGSR